jgi:hypothetical protein
MVLWMMEVSVAPVMVLVVACYSGDDFGGGGFLSLVFWLLSRVIGSLDI